MKISHKLCVKMDRTQSLILWWFTAKNEGGNDIIAWVYIEIKLEICLTAVNITVVNITDNLCTKKGNMGLKSAFSNQERFQIKSRL